ncbi:hypothetical protein R55227_BLOPHJLP_00293 [Fructobacillus tropaeoli]|uniref:Accessory Sec system protein Asp3 n=1 Tax=Fructobacillus tropaeoli TaxID=709323 RepID=A0ABN9YKQ4_9LACO|nr:hypothetical protein R55227_BLOPHJLP_00293 [Fructobacillus tropaeoli]CAK1229564.1 hypothetical protein R53137_KAKDMLNK_00285 [Fructobacillus tropaeoli]
MQYQIYWQPQTVLHELQGAIVDFIKENEVHYTNHFLPSGQVIASWTDAANYYRDKSVSDLPRLKPGRTYRTTRRVQNSKRMHAYLSWTFFDEKDQIISSQYQNSNSLDLKVPRVYSHYRLDLMSAGTGDFTFYEVTMAEKVDGWLMDQDQQITEYLGAYLAMPNQLASKTLRVILAEPEFHQTSYPIQAVKKSPQAVLYLATDLLHCQDFYDEAVLKVISQAKKEARAKDVEFVGYGLVSSMVALQYRQAVKGAKAIVANPDQLILPSGIDHYSTDLAAFLSSLPEKIEGLMSADDSLLVHYSLADNSSPIQVIRPRIELLQQLSYPEWPESRQEKLERIRAKREAEKQLKKDGQNQKSQIQSSEVNSDSLIDEKQDSDSDIQQNEERIATEKSLLATGTNQGVAPDQPLPPLGPVLVPRDLPPLTEGSQESALSQLGISVNQSQVVDQPSESPDGLPLIDSTQEKTVQEDQGETEQAEQNDSKESVGSEPKDVKESVKSDQTDEAESLESDQTDEGESLGSNQADEEESLESETDAEERLRLEHDEMRHEQKNALDAEEILQEEQLAAESSQVAEDETDSVTRKVQETREQRIAKAEANRQKQLLGFFTRNRT